MVEKMKTYCKANIKILTEDQVVRICVDSNFKEAEINTELKKYEVDKKYEGMEDYEWSTAMSRTDKKEDKKRVQMEKVEQRHRENEQRNNERRERIYKER